MKPSHLNVLKSFFLCVLGLLIYSNSLTVPFQFDDFVVITDNQSIHYLPDWPATFKAVFHFQPSRTVTLLTLALNYYVHRLDVFGYHCVNLFIHVSAAFAVWWLGGLFLRLSQSSGAVKEQALSRRRQKKSAAAQRTDIVNDHWRAHLPFAAALLFLAHPVNTQAVTYIAQRGESLAALFYVLSVCCYIQGRIGANKNAVLFLMASAVSGLLAMFSKETAVSLPLMILSVEMFFFRRKNLLRNVMMVCVPALLIVPALFGFDLRMLTAPHASQSHLGDVLTLPTYLLTQLRVFVVFMKIFVWPVGLNLDHDFEMSRTLFDPATFSSFALIAALLFAALRWRRSHPMLSWAVIWFFVALSSNLIPRAHVMFEHKLYLAAAGVIPALCLGVYPMVRIRRIFFIGMALVLAVFSYLTVERNGVWGSQVGLWQDVIKKSPDKGRAYLSLGAAYASAKQYDLALEALTKALAMMPDPRVHTTRGGVYVLKGDDERALKDFNQAIKINPAFVDAYLRRGELLARRQQYSAAVLDFNQAIDLHPAAPNGYKMRGRLNEALRRYDAALSDYNQALTIEPGDAQTLGWRGYVYALAGESDLALADFEAALRLNPKFAEGYLYRGMHRKDHGRVDEALKDFNLALELKPSFALAYYQRAQLWFQAKDWDAALRDVNRAVQLDSNSDLAYALRARLMVEKRQFKDGMEDLNTSLKINPDFIDGYLNRGLLNMTLGNLREAVADFSSALALGPKARGAYSRRARAYALLKEYDLADADLTKAIELNPQPAADYYQRAVIRQQKGDLKNALADALKARELGFNVPSDLMKALEP